MELDFALLADRVSQTPEGKLDLIGAGFDTILTPSVPAIHGRFVLALRLLVSRDELEQEHDMEVTLRNSAGEPIQPPARIHIPVLPDEQRAELSATFQGLAFAFNFDNVVFPEYGDYELALGWDHEPVGSPLRLWVRQAPDGSSA